MYRRTALAAITTLATGLVALGAASPVAARAETCQGRTATVLGTAGGQVTGTDGPDVVVSRGAHWVDTLGGDDVVCLTGTVAETLLDTGAGDDSVLAQTGRKVDGTLGPGDDTYVGSAGVDRIDTDAGADLRAGADSISTGAGRDEVGSGVPQLEVNRDVIDLGADEDRLWVRSRAGDDLSVAGGPDGAQVIGTNPLASDTWVADNVAGTLSIDGAVAWRWTDITSFDLFLARTRLTFVGSDADEQLVVGVKDHPRVDLGGGDDSLVVRGAVPGNPRVRSALSGGEGHDLVRVRTSNRVVTGDLAAGRLAVGRSHFATDGFEDLYATGTRVDLRGDRGPNVLKASGCDVTVAGGRGRDVLAVFRDVLSFPLACFEPPVPGGTLRGGRGADELLGSRGRDRLLGGPGRDTADGSAGVDRCVAERRTACER